MLADMPEVVARAVLAEQHAGPIEGAAAEAHVRRDDVVLTATLPLKNPLQRLYLIGAE